MLSLLLGAVLLLAPEVEVPANDGWVTDLGDLLSPAEEQALEGLMESYRQGTTNEIALLTVPDLGGEPIERYALGVARAWKLGGEKANNGALLVVSRDDRKMRIEVGDGLQGELTDARSGRIIREVIAPRFRSGDYAAGLEAGIRAIHGVLGGDYAVLERTAGARRTRSSLGSCFSSVFLLLLFMGLFSRRRRGGMGGILPWILLSGMGGGGGRGGGFGGGGGGGFGGFGGGGGFSGGGASGGW